MRKIKNVFEKLSFLLIAVMFVLTGCGEGGGGGSGKSVKSINGTSNKKPLVSFIGHVDVKSGKVSFEYPVKAKKGKKSFKKLYNYGPEYQLVSSGVNWDSINHIASVDIQIQNNLSAGAGNTLYGTYTTIEQITVAGVPGSVTVRNEYGYDPGGFPYFNHAPNGESIAPLATGSAVSWQFDDPTAVNFDFFGNVYADNWKQIAGDGIASTAWNDGSVEIADRQFITTMGSFNNKLYVLVGKQAHPARNTGSNNDFKTQFGGAAGAGVTGMELWEYDPSTTNWQQVNADGFGGSEDYLNWGYNNWGTALGEFNGALYAGTSKAIFGNGQSDPDNQQGGEIWRWSGTGTTWTKVHSMTDCKAVKELLEFDGNFFSMGYFRGNNKVSGANTARFDYSSTGTSGWTVVLSDAFGDTNYDGGGTPILVGSSISGAVSNVQFGTSDKYLFVAKGGLTAKPGGQIYRAGPADTTGRGKTYTNGLGDWSASSNTNGDWKKMTDNIGDDIYGTISGVPTLINGSFAWICNVTFSAAPADHALAHHHASNETLKRQSITIIDNKGSTIIYAVHANDHAPANGNKIRFSVGGNERGMGDTGNATSLAPFTFAASSENTASPADNMLGISTNNLPQGVPNYNPSGGQLFGMASAGASGGYTDSDIITKLNFFTSENYPTPSASGGANLDGVSINAGYGNRDDFTFATGTHDGWLYVGAYVFQKSDEGVRLFKSADGINWIKVTSDSFGNGYTKSPVFVSLNGKLYMGVSRPQFSTGVSSTADGSGALTAATTQLYVVDAAFPTPAGRFKTAATSGLVLDKTTAADSNNYVPESTIYIEKATYNGDTKIDTGTTLAVALPLNNGKLTNFLWATDTQIVLDNVATLPASGAIVIEGEVIQYSSISGNTLTVASLADRGSRGPSAHGPSNHAKGTPVYRTTKNAAGDYGIVLSSTAGIPTSGPSRRIVIDGEEIKYAGVSGTTLTTPLREQEATEPAAHSAGATVYKPGFTGITRGQFGTTATAWDAGETVSGGIIFGTVQLFATD